MDSMKKTSNASSQFFSIPADALDEKVKVPPSTVHMSLFPRKIEKTDFHWLSGSMRSLVKSSPKPPKEKVENVTLILAIPTRTTSTVPLCELFDSLIDDIVPSYFQKLENEIMEMIKGDNAIHSKMKKSLKLCVLNSRYSIAYVDFGQEILCTKQNASFYYRRCLSRYENPSLIVRFPGQVMSAAA